MALYCGLNCDIVSFLLCVVSYLLEELAALSHAATLWVVTGFSLWSPGLNPRAANVEFVVDKGAL